MNDIKSNSDRFILLLKIYLLNSQFIIYLVFCER